MSPHGSIYTHHMVHTYVCASVCARVGARALMDPCESLTILNRMVIECTRLSVKTKS